MLGPVEGNPLDTQQMESVVLRPRNHLILAGAGTGKTTVILGKIKYLLLTKAIKPEDVLLLSFTNAAADNDTDLVIRIS